MLLIRFNKNLDGFENGEGHADNYADDNNYESDYDDEYDYNNNNNNGPSQSIWKRPWSGVVREKHCHRGRTDHATLQIYNISWKYMIYHARHDICQKFYTARFSG